MSNFDDELKQLELRNQERNKRLLNSILAKVPLFTGILIALWWVFYGTLDIEWSVTTVVKDVILTIATIVFAITYCNLIAEGGFRMAENTEDYKTSLTEYRKAVKENYRYKNEITEYASQIAFKNLKELRKRNLESNFLKYEDFYDENDRPKIIDLKSRKDLTRYQKKVIRKCARAYIVLPNIFEFTSEGYFGLKREKTKKEYLTTQQISKFITRTVLSFVSLGLIFRFTGFNVSGILYAFFQIVLWTASGVSQRLSNYRFVLENLLPQLDSKTLIINSYKHNNIETGGIEENGSREQQ